MFVCVIFVSLNLRFYKSSKTQPSANMVFLLASGGHFNYFGTKKWLEDPLAASSSSQLLSDVKFTVCLDSLGNVDVSDTTWVIV